MSSQQFPRHGLPTPSGGTPQISAAAAAANLVPVNQPSNAQGNVPLSDLIQCIVRTVIIS